MPRKKSDPTCPRCEIRDKILGYGYCLECRRAYQRERYAKMRAMAGYLRVEDLYPEVRSAAPPLVADEAYYEAESRRLEEMYGPPPPGFGQPEAPKDQDPSGPEA